MSEYAQKATEYKDASLLCEALKEMGYANVLHHETPQHLYGYKGDRREQTADIIIPRRDVGQASNDVGFARQPNGAYAAIISQYDSRAGACDAAWLKKLKATYAEKGVMRQAQREGLRFTGKKTVAGKVKLQFVKS